MDCFASLAMTSLCQAALTAVITRAKAGDPVRRGFSAQAPTSLEYWNARSRLRQGFDEAFAFRRAEA
ncbi:hypothetical protein BSN85_39135 [Bradyrhizobium brasilense]|nr:hypothetical protein BSN85_39135 [Bradyrhizobium brasilense]